jgi:hypothetical protein
MTVFGCDELRESNCEDVALRVEARELVCELSEFRLRGLQRLDAGRSARHNNR